MSYIHFSPPWFFGIDIVLEIAFAVILLMVALFAFNLYKKTSQDSLRFLGSGFLLIGFSYIIQSVLNFLILLKLNENICKIFKIQSVATFDTLGIIIHIFLMTLGLSLLTYATLKNQQLRLLLLIIILPLVSIFLGKNLFTMFYLITTVLLIIIEWHFIENYIRNKQKHTLLLALAFLFLLFGHFHFLLSLNHSLFYVIGHILELFAYLLILSNLYIVKKK